MDDYNNDSNQFKIKTAMLISVIIVLLIVIFLYYYHSKLPSDNGINLPTNSHVITTDTVS